MKFFQIFVLLRFDLEMFDLMPDYFLLLSISIVFLYWVVYPSLWYRAVVGNRGHLNGRQCVGHIVFFLHNPQVVLTAF